MRAPPVARPPTRRTDTIMDTIRRLMILSMCGWAHCEPLGDAMRRRSDGFGIYASQYTQDYEPYIFAAIPLNPPMPILHVLSPKPLSPPKRDHHRAGSIHHSAYSRPSYADSEHVRPSYAQSAYRPSYAPSEYIQTSHPQKEYAPNSYDYEQTYAQAHVHPTSITHVTYGKPPQQPEPAPYPATQESQTILYARPNVHGGYSYHKQPTKTSTAPKRSPTTESPIILRVHKYRIVKNR